MPDRMHYGKILIPAGDLSDLVITGLDFEPTDILFRGVDCNAGEMFQGGARGTTQNGTFYKVLTGTSTCGGCSVHAVISTNLQARVFSIDSDGFTMKVDLNTLSAPGCIGYLAWKDE